MLLLLHARSRVGVEAVVEDGGGRAESLLDLPFLD